MKTLSVAIVQGGPSTEAEVSRSSAKGISQALLHAGHRVVCLELVPTLAESLRTGAFDVVFPIAHGAVGEDGALQGLLEVLALPYVGSGVLASALAMDKRRARQLFACEGLPLAPGLALARGNSTVLAHRVRDEIGKGVVVKPSSHGSAIGVRRIEADAPLREVAEALKDVWLLDPIALVEHFAKGREITCGVLDLDEPVAFSPTEIVAPHDDFYTYRARYAAGGSQHQCPAALSESLTKRVRDIAVAAHRALGCRDLSRVDFVVGDLEDLDCITLLEVNTLPGFTSTSLYPEAAAIAGFPIHKLCDALVQHAYARGPTPRHAPLALP